MNLGYVGQPGLTLSKTCFYVYLLKSIIIQNIFQSYILSVTVQCTISLNCGDGEGLRVYISVHVIFNRLKPTAPSVVISLYHIKSPSLRATNNSPSEQASGLATNILINIPTNLIVTRLSLYALFSRSS
jgi:hypothetical protein